MCEQLLKQSLTMRHIYKDGVLANAAVWRQLQVCGLDNQARAAEGAFLHRNSAADGIQALGAGFGSRFCCMPGVEQRSTVVPAAAVALDLIPFTRSLYTSDICDWHA